MEILSVNIFLYGKQTYSPRSILPVRKYSAYVVNSINNKWVYSWKKNNWIKSDKSKAKNIELWERLLELIDYHNVKFVKVKGHADNEYNNRCDKLAVKAREDIVK